MIRAAREPLFSGRQPTIVMIHGMWSTPAVWAEFASYFEPRGFTVMTPALRHHHVGGAGAAPDAVGGISLTEHIDDLAQFIGALGEPPILFGHSMGGLLAQQLASRGLARAVVLLAPANRPGIASLRLSTIRFYSRALFRRRFWRRAHLPNQTTAAHGLFHLLSPEECRRRIADLVPDSGRALFEIALPWLDRRRAAKIEIERIRCPILILAGSQDRAIPAPCSRRLKARYAERATYVELSEHAHWLIGEPGWEQIAAICDDWLRSVLASRDGT